MHDALSQQEHIALQAYLQQHLPALTIAFAAEPMADALVDEHTAPGFAAALQKLRDSRIDLPQTPPVVRVNAAIEAWLAVAQLDAVLREQRTSLPSVAPFLPSDASPSPRENSTARWTAPSSHPAGGSKTTVSGSAAALQEPAGCDLFNARGRP